VLSTLLAVAAGLIVGAAIAALWMSSRDTKLSADRAGLDAELGATRRALEEQKALDAQSHTQIR
jgi:hypothetical protein